MPVAALGAIALVAVAVVAGLFVSREDPEARPVDEAVEDFRSTEDNGDDAPTELRPTSGVYQLSGQGHEAISFPPVTQTDGSTMPMTISSLPEGCWRLRVDYNEAHWQDWELCPDGDLLLEMGGHTFQRWDFGAAQVENLSTFTCDPPAPFAVFDVERDGSDDSDSESNEVMERSCTGLNDQVEGTTVTSGTITVVGIETVEVDGEELEAVRFRTENVISGAQSGVNDFDMWLSTTDGLPLRGERNVRVDSDSPIGTITYTEEGSWQLDSTTPQR